MFDKIKNYYAFFVQNQQKSRILQGWENTKKIAKHSPDYLLHPVFERQSVYPHEMLLIVRNKRAVIYDTESSDEYVGIVNEFALLT